MNNGEQSDVKYDSKGFELSPSPTDQKVYVEALATARKELASEREEQKKREAHIAALEQTVKSLAAICEDQETPIPPNLPMPSELTEDVTGLGLTDAIRKVLSSHRIEMTPTEIRDALVDNGMDLSKYANQMVPIHNTLKRLYDQGELARSKNEPTRYLWLNSMYRAMRMAQMTTVALQPTSVPKDFETK